MVQVEDQVEDKDAGRMTAPGYISYCTSVRLR